MKLVQKISLILASFILLSVNVSAEVFDGLGGKSINHPATTAPTQQSAQQPAQQPANAMQQPTGPAAQGKIVEATTAAGYTYMLLEAGGKQFWVAGTQVTAQKGDVVSYVTNVTMQNFTSKTMNKTFDSIIFASSVSVVK